MRRTRAGMATCFAALVSGCTAGPPAEPTRPTADTVATSAAPACTQPLVLARHHAHGPFRLTERRARTLADEPPPGVRVRPAAEIGPRLRVAVVDGVHPMRRPEAYPLRVDAPCSEDPVQPVTLTVVGDVMLARGVATAAAGDLGRPLAAAAPLLRRADLTAGNLESTLSRAGAPTQGDDSFGADPSAARALVDAGFDVVSLANNHTGDFGPRALRQTVTRLRAAGLRTFGAGRDLAAARRPAVVAARGTTYGFVGFNAIGETPEAGSRRPGALSVSMPPRTGPLDRAELDRFLHEVRRLDRRVDVVVAMPHWGTQYTHRPEPVQRHVARAMVAAGADLVVGGHPHWLQGVSTVGDALVVQSLGNFVFDMDFMTRTMEGAVLETVWWGSELKAAELVPYRMDSSFTPRFVPWEEGRAILAPVAPWSRPAYRF